MDFGHVCSNCLLCLFFSCGDFLSQTENTFRFFCLTTLLIRGFLPHMQEKKTLFYSPAQFHVKCDPCTLYSDVVRRLQLLD